jgi:hypothetical protein
MLVRSSVRKPYQRDLQRVPARLQVGDQEIAFGVADRDARIGGGLVDDRHRGARNHSRLLVDDGAGDRSCNGLGEGGAWQQSSRDESHKEAAERS